MGLWNKLTRGVDIRIGGSRSRNQPGASAEGLPKSLGKHLKVFGPGTGARRSTSGYGKGSGKAGKVRR